MACPVSYILHLRLCVRACPHADGVKWHRVERSSGSLRRQVKLPASANLEGLTAAADNGVLTISCPKKPEAAAAGPRRIAIA
jgi:HSP20 family molecular chaperone IbpA